jgi:alpha-galactosidase
MEADWEDTDEGKAAMVEALRHNLNKVLDDDLLPDCCAGGCTVCTAFKNLAHRLLDSGCTVCIMQNQIDSFATFEAPGRIHINRHDAHVNARGTKVELIGLAHEAGHWRSQVQGTRDDDLMEDILQRQSNLTREEHRALMAEEERAWALGRAFLADVAPNLPGGFWDLWDATRVDLLGTYQALRR